MRACIILILIYDSGYCVCVGVLGGSVVIREGAALLNETRKICGCSSLRTAMQEVFTEETSARLRSIEQIRCAELDRRTTM